MLVDGVIASMPPLAEHTSSDTTVALVNSTCATWIPLALGGGEQRNAITVAVALRLNDCGQICEPSQSPGTANENQ